MILFWILSVLISIILGIVITLSVQYYLFKKYFKKEESISLDKKVKVEPFQLPKVLLDVIHCSQLVTKESCIALNLILQFLFHELRDTERIRLWFRNKLCLEFEELLSKSTIGKMVGSIRIIEINLGSEFPVINSITIQNVKVNDIYSHIDNLDLKLDVNYSGGFRLVIEANMLLGKAAHISIKVDELYGEGRLQFNRLPYSHWSFSFYNEPKLQLHVESHFQGRPFHQITNFISNQIKKSLKKKHILPNYKIRYKPFFHTNESSMQACQIPPGQLQIIIHKISRLNDTALENCEIYCSLALDFLPWIEIINYGSSTYYLLDIIITKKVHQIYGFSFRQEYLEDKKQVCVILEDMKPHLPMGQDSVCRDDIVLSIDGKKVTSVNQVQKLIKSAAFQFTIRVERKIINKTYEENFETASFGSGGGGAIGGSSYLGLRKRKNSETESGGSSTTASVSGSPSNKTQGKKSSPDLGKAIPLASKDSASEDSDLSTKLVKSKCMLNKQIVLFEESFTLHVKSEDRFLNLNVRCKENDSCKDKLLGFVNIPLVEVQNASDTLRCLRLKPPDSFEASSIRNHKLQGHSGFIPLLCYGDIVLTLQFFPSIETLLKFVPEIIEPSVTPESESLPGLFTEEKKHDFIKTHFQTSTQCEFCGKKIWLKDAEKCKDCGMTCHKKCVAKCMAGTICMPRSDCVLEGLEEGCSNDEELLRSNLALDSMPSSRDTTPQPTPTKKRLGHLLATVASASRGLKRVGSANNLILPGDPLQNSQSRSLPPSPQQSPASSRKASLPFEVNEEIAILLQTLMEHGSDQPDMMDFAKETGKTLYEDLGLAERREKINEMINKLKLAISAEADIRFSLSKEEQYEKDPTNKAKIVFLIGKSDEKTQALTILMLHLCAGLQHIQDLEDQEKENESSQDIIMMSEAKN